MRLKVIQVGNSKGIRIPKTILDEYGIKDEVEVDLKAEGISIKPLNKPRENWKEVMRELHVSGGDELLIPDVFEDEEI
jgi:antitoxin MazE